MSFFLERCREKKPAIAIAHATWDDTGHRLAFDKEKAGQASRAETFIYRLRIVIAWNSHAALTHQLVLPPFTVASTAASNIWDSPHLHPHMRPLTCFVQELRSLATRGAHMHEQDDASGYRSELAHVFTLAELRGALVLALSCGLHHVSIMEEGVALAMGAGFVKRHFIWRSVAPHIGHIS